MSGKIEYKVRSLWVDFSQVNCDADFNTRKKMANLDELAESIRILGQTTPVGVVEREDGAFDLVWGFRRYNAIKALNDAGVDTRILVDVVVSKDKNQLILLNVQENVSREQLSLSEEFNACKKLSAFMSKAEICEALGVTSTWITQRLKLGDLSDVLLSAVDEGLSIRSAASINMLPAELHEEYAARATSQSVSAVIDSVQERLDRIAGIDPAPQDDDDVSDIELLDEDDIVEPLDDDEVEAPDDESSLPLSDLFKTLVEEATDLSESDTEKVNLMVGAIRWSKIPVEEQKRLVDLINILFVLESDEAESDESAF